MRRRRDDREAGTSLAEVLIAMALTMGLLAVITTSVIATQRSARQSEARTTDVNQARTAAFAITRAIRAAAGPTIDTAALLSGDDDSVTFYTNIANGEDGAIGAPFRYTYALRAAGAAFELVETVREPDPRPSGSTAPPTYSAGAPERTRVLARRVVREPGQPVFAFADVNEQRLGALQSGERRLQPADLDSVTSIVLRLAVQTTTKPGVDPTLIVNRVRLSNAYFQGS